GFNDLLDGTGAGVLEHKGSVYYTCIPKLWRLRDDDGDDRADRREVLAEGFGVRVALRGHDMHGLIIGPDGRLYFSIGDRGYNVRTREGRHLLDPGSGAVFRCELDGSGLEVFCRGLRNPQELAFDDHGNLFTVDNNCDAGDRARIVHLVEGGQTGWRMCFQSRDDRGAWMPEDWWKPKFEGQAAFLVPPVANLGSGPSGLACYPGVGLSSDYAGWFFFCDFLGGRKSSGVRAFRLEPEGATFKLAEDHHFVKGLLPTDVSFGPDGTVWVSDWVEGWVGEGKGRLYRIRPAPDPAAERLSNETAALLAGSFDDLDPERLAGLLAHSDRRVRTEAQLALVDRPTVAAPFFRNTLAKAPTPLARLHALWGLAILARRGETTLDDLVKLAADADEEIRGQAAKVFGEARVEAAIPYLLLLCRNDPSPRVMDFAVRALGRFGQALALDAVAEVLRTNADQDPVLRQGASWALAQIGKGHRDELLALAKDPAPAVRMGLCLALRELEDAQVARLLHDPVPQIVTEAARAIWDRPIRSAFADLAQLIETTPLDDDALWRRILAANEHLGGPEVVAALIRFVADPQRHGKLRARALRALADWDLPPGREAVLGEWRPCLPRGSRGAVAPLMVDHIVALVADRNEAVAESSIQLAAAEGLRMAIPGLEARLGDSQSSGRVRVAALRGLADFQVEGLQNLAAQALASNDSKLRAEAASLLARLDPVAAIPILERAIATGQRAERQLGISALADMNRGPADAILAQWMEQLLSDADPSTSRLGEIRLETLAAANRRAESGSRSLQRLVDLYERATPVEDRLARRAVTLQGGDAKRGEKVFREHEASCLRCHSVDGGATTNAGPDLADIGKTLDRKLILESIVYPNARIREGYASEEIYTKDDRAYIGRLVSESEDQVEIEVNDYGRLEVMRIARDRIAERRTGKSAMPEDLDSKLNDRQLRDLIEFLSQQRKP
ncbi:MAG: HEAT repeat domain-containing protein, partial [Planctomycetes bacterium]|nr:HEAT repeat domain-containing protein [Planctomycetota bacterium]